MTAINPSSSNMFFAHNNFIANTIVSYLISHDSEEEELKFGKDILCREGLSEVDLLPLRTNSYAMRLFLAPNDDLLKKCVTTNDENASTTKLENDKTIFALRNSWEGEIFSPIFIHSLNKIAFIVKAIFDKAVYRIEMWDLTTNKLSWALRLSETREWGFASLAGTTGDYLVREQPGLTDEYFNISTGDVASGEVSEGKKLIQKDRQLICCRNNCLFFEDLDLDINGQYQIERDVIPLHYSYNSGYIGYLAFQENSFLHVVDCVKGKELYSITYKEIGGFGVWKKIIVNPENPAHVYLGDDKGFVSKFDCNTKTLTTLKTGVTADLFTKADSLGWHKGEVDDLMLDGDLLVSTSTPSGHDDPYGNFTPGKIIVWNLKTNKSLVEEVVYSSPKLIWFRNGRLAYTSDNHKTLKVVNVLAQTAAYNQHTVF